MFRIALMAFTLFGLFSCKDYKDLSVNDFKKMLLEDGAVQLVDVRTPGEYAGGHIAGAVNIDWLAEGFLEKAEVALEKGRPVMVYCRSGRRSAAAAAALSGKGYVTTNLKGGYIAWTAAGEEVTTYEFERFCTPAGAPVGICLIKHASLAVSYKGLSIQVDPVSELGKPTDYEADFPKADAILVTHEHFDHFDKDAINTLTKEGTVLITNLRCAQMLGRGTALANGGSADLPGGIKVYAVPAYNTTEDRQQFHPKGRDNGYIIDIEGFRIYIAGDTEDIPEMAEVKDIDVAFLPCNQPYTMTPGQCIAAAKVVAPKVLIPYHFSQTDISSIPEALPGIDVRIRNMQ